MAETAQSILDKARELSGRDRVHLVEALVDSLERPSESYASDPDALKMLQHVREILCRLRLRQALGTSRSATPEPGRRMAAALEALVARSAVQDMADASEWERDIRRDRPLPG